MKDSQILVMAHKKADVKTHKGSLPKSLSHVQTVSTTLEDSQSIIKEHFDRLRMCVRERPRIPSVLLRIPTRPSPALSHNMPSHLTSALLHVSGLGRMRRFLVQVAHAARENKIKEEDSMLN